MRKKIKIILELKKEDEDAKPNSVVWRVEKGVWRSSAG